MMANFNNFIRGDLQKAMEDPLAREYKDFIFEVGEELCTAVKNGVGSRPYNMANKYNRSDCMNNVKFFKFKFITLKREDEVVVDGSGFDKALNGVEGYGYQLKNGNVICTAKINDEYLDFHYRQIFFNSDYFLEKKEFVDEVPAEYILELKK